METILLLGQYQLPYVRKEMEYFQNFFAPHFHVRTYDLSHPNVEVKESSAEFALVFGGDGTIIYAARLLVYKRIPILGVNLGKLGFLTGATSQELQNIPPKALLAYFQISRRLTLEVRVLEGKKTLFQCPVINDLVISFIGISRIIPISYRLDGEYVTTAYGDGLIVATPVGSTAYSLSAGGPVITPEMEALVITPICPHTLNNRPLIIDAKTQIQLTVAEKGKEAALTVDGQITKNVDHRHKIVVRRSRFPFILLQPTDQSFFKTMRQKLGWSEPPRYKNH
ncbi:MAG: NAD(+)/NADH kinase [Planctomycetota bacterium]|nr:MAG: NAD(+)/NADH kinase [Planctomycetota bacterium]